MSKLKNWEDPKRRKKNRDRLKGRPEVVAPDFNAPRSAPSDVVDSPIYTVILHGPRKKLGLTVNEYTIIDTIDRLSNRPPDFEWCTKSVDSMAEDLGISRATVFRAIKKGVDLGMVEKKGYREIGHKTTMLWYETVSVKRRSIRKSKAS